MHGRMDGCMDVLVWMDGRMDGWIMEILKI